MIPVLSLLIKDHKQTVANRVPASRPVCGASSSINRELSEWVSSVLDSVCKSEDTDEAISGKETCAYIDDLVEKMKILPEEESVFVGSLDAKALFPSLKIKESAKLVARRVQEAEVKFENVDYKWASMYCTLNMEFTDVVRQDLQAIVPRKRAKRGSDPTVRTVSAQEETSWKWFTDPAKYTDGDKRRLLAKVMEILVETTLSQHFYKWGPHIRRQSEGGAIGLRATGSIARVVMDDWLK